MLFATKTQMPFLVSITGGQAEIDRPSFSGVKNVVNSFLCFVWDHTSLPSLALLSYGAVS